MRLLDKIEVNYKDEIKSVELHHGDLTSLSANESFDLLILSAFPNDYIPTPSSLIGALHKKGLSVNMLSKVKELDLRSQLACWLSIKVEPKDYPGIQFSRILCFEPLIKNQGPPELVGDIFQALFRLTEEYEIKSVAMPILSTGDAMYPINKMLPVLIEACVNWMKIGLNLGSVKIVAHSENQAKEATSIFSREKGNYEIVSPLHGTSKGLNGVADTQLRYKTFKYDYFISYSHNNYDEAKILYENLLSLDPNLKVFIDKNELKTGHAWQQELYEALEDCKYVFALLSPDYLNSKVCLEEYHIAHFRHRESDTPILLPVYLYSSSLPVYMKLTQYIDCREGSQEKLESVELM